MPDVDDKEMFLVQELLMIADKGGNDVPFILNKTQEKYARDRTQFDIITKARQEGMSSIILALFLIRCLHKRNTKAVVISHDQESTERLFRRVKYYIENLRGPKPVLETSSKRELSFPKTNSVFFVGTAGARRFGRGDTITDLHCSEVAFWDNPKELTAGLFQAVPKTSGRIILESTGNGKNWFHKRVMRSLKGIGRYKLHFYDWLDFPEYNLEISKEEGDEIISSLDPDLEEDILYNEHGVTPGQLKFRRDALDDLDYDLDLFKQEYPMSVDECFRSTGKSLFTKVRYLKSDKWIRKDVNFWGLTDEPKTEGLYALGVDVGGGVGADYSVIQVIDLLSLEQVGEFSSNRFSPDHFATKVADLGREFNLAYVTVESNNHGLVTLDNLRKIYPPYLIYRKPGIKSTGGDKLLNMGLLQTSRTKPLVIGTLRRMLATSLLIHSPLLRDELDTFIETETGKLEAEEGCFDDRVMAMGVFAFTFEKVLMRMAPAPPPQPMGHDPFLIDNIIDELQGRSSKGFPIKRQIGGFNENIISLN